MIPAFCIIASPDSYLFQNKLDSLLDSLPLPDNSTWKKTVFWGNEPLPANFWELLTLQTLFSIPQAIIVRDAQLIPVETLKKISPILLGNSGLTLPVLHFSVPFEKGQPKIAQYIQKLPFFIAAQKNNTLYAIPEITQQQLPQFITQEAQRRGVHLSKEEAHKISTMLPCDAAIIHTELEKLALVTDENGKLASPLEDVIIPFNELGIFELIASIQTYSRLPEMWDHLLKEQASGDTIIFGLIALMQREARLLWQLATGENPFIPGRLASVKKQLAAQLGHKGIAQIWDLCLYAEKSIKSGEASPDQAMDLLTASLLKLFRTGSRDI